MDVTRTSDKMNVAYADGVYSQGVPWVVAHVTQTTQSDGGTKHH